jgi:S-adenosylmethionine:tRNA ribosyltransferase-isomerase
VRHFTLDDFDFDLPDDLIAQAPAVTRSASRLLHVAQGALTDHVFTDLPELVLPGDLLVFNDTRVIKARLTGSKASGGRVELLVERVIGSDSALVQLRASHPPQVGARLSFGLDDVAFRHEATVVDRDGRFFLLRFDHDVWQVIEQIGQLPLPPYIRHPAAGDDLERYQTVYAKTPGAVAAPTAGLHFDDRLLDQLTGRGVGLGFLTLHVGAGTFLPVQSDDLDAHTMHREWYSIDPVLVDQVEQTRAGGGRVVAVGTTALRALEAASASGRLASGAAETDIFIRPGYRFRTVDRLLTNFHLPRSTLLMLVAAFAGYERMQSAYRHAVESRYRFFSYGDAMLLEPEAPR